MVRAHLRIRRRTHQSRLLSKAAQFSAQFFGPGALFPLLPTAPACCAGYTHARWPNGSGISRREAISGEPQYQGGKRVQLGLHPDESITGHNDWPQDLVKQRISLPRPGRISCTRGNVLSIKTNQPLGMLIQADHLCSSTEVQWRGTLQRSVSSTDIRQGACTSSCRDP